MSDYWIVLSALAAASVFLGVISLVRQRRLKDSESFQPLQIFVGGPPADVWWSLITTATRRADRLEKIVCDRTLDGVLNVDVERACRRWSEELTTVLQSLDEMEHDLEDDDELSGLAPALPQIVLDAIAERSWTDESPDVRYWHLIREVEAAQARLDYARDALDKCVAAKMCGKHYLLAVQLTHSEASLRLAKAVHDLQAFTAAFPDARPVAPQPMLALFAPKRNA